MQFFSQKFPNPSISMTTFPTTQLTARQLNHKMKTCILLRRLLRMPDASRTLLTSTTRPQSQSQSRSFALLPARHLSTPTILRPSFWASMVPRPLRSSPTSTPSPRREWNPATPYIVLALLVGSQAIQILWLKQERAEATRKAEARIGVLREVVGRVQRGESVDVEGVLGEVGGWEEGEFAGEKVGRGANVGVVVKGIEEEELLFRSGEERRREREAAAVEEEENERREEEKRRDEEGKQKGRDKARVRVEAVGGAKFY